MAPKSIRSWMLIILPFAIVLAYVLIASYKLRYPGSQYDESLYLNAALGGVDSTTFITKSFHGIPVLLMPYIGALKAFIFFPIFKLFGVSPMTMRLPDIFLTGAALYILFRLLINQVGRFLSLSILAITALDASFIMFTRLDNGPVVLDFLLKVISLFVLLRFAKEPKTYLALLFWLTIILGEYNKLNFIWYANASAIAFIVIYGRGAWRTQNPLVRKKTIFLSAACYFLCVGYYLYTSRTYHLATSFGFVGWHQLYSRLSTIVNGSWFYNYSLSQNRIGSSVIFWVVLAVILVGVISILWLNRKNQPSSNFVRFYKFVALYLLLILLQLSFTKSATAGWHYFSIYPFLGTLLVLSLNEIVKVLNPKKVRLADIMLTLSVSFLCIYQINVYRQYTKLYGSTPSNKYWSTAIYKLVDYTKTKNSPIVSLDWGTQTVLIGFDHTPNKYYEVFGPISVNNAPQNSLDFQRYIATKPGAYYVTHPKNQEIFPEVTKDFFVLAKSHGYQQYKVATIKDDSTPVFEIYQLKQ